MATYGAAAVFGRGQMLPIGGRLREQTLRMATYGVIAVVGLGHMWSWRHSVFDIARGYPLDPLGSHRARIIWRLTARVNSTYAGLYQPP